VELSPETCRVKPLRRINAIVASCWIYFTIKAAYNNTLTPGTYPKEKKLESKHGESLKSRTMSTCFIFYLNSYKYIYWSFCADSEKCFGLEHLQKRKASYRITSYLFATNTDTGWLCLIFLSPSWYVAVTICALV